MLIIFERERERKKEREREGEDGKVRSEIGKEIHIE